MMKTLRYLLMSLLALAALTLAACGGGGSGPPAAGPDTTPVTNTTFESTTLGGLPAGGFSAGVAINDAGMVVGYAADGDNNVKGVLWDASITDPAPAAAELAPLAGNNYSAAYGVNTNNIVVGESGVTVGPQVDGNTVAVYWTDQSLPAVNLAIAGLNDAMPSAAYSINDGGEIVGEANGGTVAVYWADTGADPVILGNLATTDGISAAYFIKGSQIVGESLNDAGRLQAVYWTIGLTGDLSAAMPLALPDTILLDDVAASVAFGVNMDGAIVGEVEMTNGSIKGVLWPNTGPAVVYDDASMQAVNLDMIAGYKGELNPSDRASVWNVGAIATDSQKFSPAFSQAYGINDSSHIVGISSNAAFIAVPQ